MTNERLDMLRYDISPLDPEAHLFIIGITIPNPTEESQYLELPNWIPGSYLIRDFAANVQHEEAFIGETPVSIVKTDKSTWRVDTKGIKKGEELRVFYHVWAFDTSVRTSYLDGCRGFFNPAAVFMRAIGIDNVKLAVNINPPVDEMHSAVNDWKVATGLRRAKGTKRYNWGTYEADSYEQLIDCPVELGDFTVLSVKAHGVRHDIVLNDLPVNFDDNKFAEDVKTICEAEIAFFEPETKKAPMSEYTFLVNVTSSLYGGLEHSNSCALAVESKCLPCVHDKSRTKDYVRLLGLIAHEYFHSWNVKRIKPAEFIVCDLAEEVTTPSLWIFEGFTSYYDDLILRRTGLIDDATYAELLTENFKNVLESDARSNQTLTEASFDAWIKFYRPTANTPNANVSYYRQGALAALVLDATIRSKTKGKKSLDDVMRGMWADFKEAGKKYAGVTQESLAETAKRETGLNLARLIDDLVNTTDTPDYIGAIKPLGMKLTATKRTPVRSILGIAGKGTDAGFAVRTVYDHEAAQWIGIAPGDVLIAIDGMRITATNIEQILSRYAEGDQLVVHAFRDDSLMVWAMLIGQSPEVLSTVALKPTALGKAWLAA